MKQHLLDRLRCPACRGSLHIDKVTLDGDEIESGRLTCDACSIDYPLIECVPRFVPAENYASNFGFQWNRFRKTQLDSHSGRPISRERFFRQTGWSPAELTDKWVLDVGCGAGRFAEIALSCGAHVVAVDYSSAVDACWKNLGPHPRLHVVQADVYALPFAPGAFDFVYCFGVLQHTPDPALACQALPQQLCEGGKLAVDAYPQLAANLLWPKYWLRPLTKRIPRRWLFPLVERWVRIGLPPSVLVGRIPRWGRKLRYLVPVANYDGVLPLTRAQLYQWAVLDTFDMFAPAHDHPQRAEDLRSWFQAVGLGDVQALRDGLVIARGIKPKSRLSRAA